MTEQSPEYRIEAGTMTVPALDGVHGSILFKSPLDTWRVEINDENVTLEHGGRSADCVLSCKEPGDLVRVIRGEQNLVTALLQGRVSVEGNAILAVQVAGAIPTLRMPEEAAGQGNY